MAKLNKDNKKKIKDLEKKIQDTKEGKKTEDQKENEIKVEKARKKAHSMIQSLWKPVKIFGWLIFMLIGIYFPCYLAQIYENSIYQYGLNSMSKMQAAHFSNMITFAYNVAALFTVLIAYLMTKKLITIIKKPINTDKENDK